MEPRYEFRSEDRSLKADSPYMSGHGRVMMPVLFFARFFPGCSIGADGRVNIRATDLRNGAALDTFAKG